MIFVMLLESFILSKRLCHKRYNFSIYSAIFISNIISGVIGIITTMILNEGWLLVVWSPWVSSHEIDISNPKNVLWLAIFYLIAFVATLIIGMNNPVRFIDPDG